MNDKNNYLCYFLRKLWEFYRNVGYCLEGEEGREEIDNFKIMNFNMISRVKIGRKKE